MKRSYFICLFFIALTGFHASNALAAYSDHSNKLFGRQEIINVDMSAFTKWTRVIHAQAKAPTTEKTREWHNFVDSIRDQDPEDQLKAVNSYMNEVSYISDKANYGTNDYWATVEEFMARGGDCEDYAFAKYTVLLALGFEAEQMRIVILNDTSKNEQHAVLAVSYNGHEQILDNQQSRVRDAADITNYVPIYAISDHKWWRFV